MPTTSKLSGGELTVDPSENVKALTEAANVRQDDLRTETNRRMDAELRHIKKSIKSNSRHQRELRKAEAFRLNSIRQVDRDEVNKLASVTSNTAEALRGQVATTAQAAAQSLANSMGEVNKRLSALELSSSEGKGQKTVADPRLEALVEKVERIAAANSSTSGQTQGAKNLWAILAGIIALLFTAGSFLLAVLGFVMLYVLRK